jgi:acetyl esterase/lipase
MLYELIDCPEMPGSRLYMPTSLPIKGGVMVLHGSGGGDVETHDVHAHFLAAQGYAALAFTWCTSPAFPMDGVPIDVWDIDLERTVAAFRWLKARPEMAGKRAAIYGGSRGGEQALLLAAMSAQYPSEVPRPDAIVALVPSDETVGGWSWSSYRRLWRKLSGKPDLAWRWHGKYLPILVPIPIELYDGPVLLCHGALDTMWDEGPFQGKLRKFCQRVLRWWPFEMPKSVKRTERLEARLKNAQRPVEVQYLEWEEHIFSQWGEHAHRKKMIEFLGRTIG